MEMNFEEENNKNTQSRFLTKKVNEEKKINKKRKDKYMFTGQTLMFNRMGHKF